MTIKELHNTRGGGKQKSVRSRGPNRYDVTVARCRRRAARLKTTARSVRSRRPSRYDVTAARTRGRAANAPRRPVSMSCSSGARRIFRSSRNWRQRAWAARARASAVVVREITIVSLRVRREGYSNERIEPRPGTRLRGRRSRSRFSCLLCSHSGRGEKRGEARTRRSGGVAFCGLALTGTARAVREGESCRVREGSRPYTQREERRVCASSRRMRRLPATSESRARRDRGRRESAHGVVATRRRRATLPRTVRTPFHLLSTTTRRRRAIAPPPPRTVRTSFKLNPFD